MAAYFFSSPIDIDVMLEGEDVRKQIETKAEKDRPVSSPVYYDGESVSGQVRPLVLLLGSPLLLRFSCAEN
jgi:vacuolar protein sorting-associated protein 26